MTIGTKSSSGRTGARSILVWDPLVRLIHWGLALTILLNGTIVEDESSLHEWVGYIAVGLVVTRLIWGVLGSQYAKFSAFPPNILAAVRHVRDVLRDDMGIHLTHNPLGALMAYNMWCSVLALGVTGYMMGTIQFFGIEWVEEVHELIFYWLVVSIALHIGGVVFDTRRSGVPLVWSMIDGRKRVPHDRSIL